MNKTVFVMTKDDFLFQKIRLILLEENVAAVRTNSPEGSAGVVLADIDTMPSAPNGAVRMSRSSKCELSIPFTDDRLRLAVLDGSRTLAPLTLGDRCAYLDGKEIRLTEQEFALLSLLCSHGGFVSREELILSVWGKGADGGVLNVYIHYLREKLEFRGEKIIISSRGQGYKIEEKFLLKGGAQC